MLIIEDLCSRVTILEQKLITDDVNKKHLSCSSCQANRYVITKMTFILFNSLRQARDIIAGQMRTKRLSVRNPRLLSPIFQKEKRVDAIFLRQIRRRSFKTFAQSELMNRTQKVGKSL